MKPCILALKNKRHFRITELIFTKVYKRIKVKMGRLLFELGSFKKVFAFCNAVLVSVKFVDIYSCKRPRLWHWDTKHLPIVYVLIFAQNS